MAPFKDEHVLVSCHPLAQFYVYGVDPIYLVDRAGVASDSCATRSPRIIYAGTLSLPDAHVSRREEGRVRAIQDSGTGQEE